MNNHQEVGKESRFAAGIYRIILSGILWRTRPELLTFGTLMGVPKVKSAFAHPSASRNPTTNPGNTKLVFEQSPEIGSRRRKRGKNNKKNNENNLDYMSIP
jgi:hypothetical protein